MTVTTEKELGEALKNNQETIEIEGDLTKKVIKIKATGKTAWIIAFGAIGVAVVVTIASGGTAAPVSALAGGAAVSILGVPAATSAVAIAIAAGGVGALSSLRKYKIVSNNGSKLILMRK